MTDLRIKRLGAQGDGVADGPLYVPRALPGETVSGRIDGATVQDVKILTPSDHRVAPVCRHYTSCGGCQLQHADDAFVADWKVEVVRQALDAHGLDAHFRPIATSPAQSRRRAGFAARRTKKGALVGFHGRASDTIVAIPECQLLVSDLLNAVPFAEALATAGASRKAVLTVMVTQSATGLDVAVRDGKELDGPLRQKLAGLCEAAGVARLTWGDEIVAMRAPPVQRMGTADITPPAGAFLQATAHGQTVLTDAVLEIAHHARRVVDLFAGCGTFTLPLLAQADVHAVEGDGEMLAALHKGWRHAEGLKTVTVETRDLFRRPLLPDEVAKADAVILDPPRAGAQAQVAQLAIARVPRLAYVSCNPVTFARDVAVLTAAGYHLDWVQVVDQFRWSAHVELVASLTASHMR